MRYMLLIYTAEDLPQGTPDEQAASMQAWLDYTEALNEAGVNLGGEPLHPTATATTVRVRDGETVTTDGPFAETKEVLGGYYLLEVDDVDQALEWAARCPAASYGSIELRPIMELSELTA